MLTIGIPKETAAGETRVAAVPDSIQKLIKAEMAVTVESGAGLKAHISDEQFAKAGATIATDAKAVYAANVIMKVTKPALQEWDLLQPETVLIAPLYANRDPAIIEQCVRRRLSAFSLDLIPRIARAQSMDILSSMSNLAGYKSVLLAADHLDKIFPMLTTAAGTILPARVMVIGAGVAGLQAIATARRLGAVVIACDTRPAVEEQVKSLGAEFFSLETTHASAQDAGGYAKEQTAAFYQHEQDIILKHLANIDVIITTALIPGKRAPILITKDMLKTLRPGAVIVDLAAEQSGNCEATQPNAIVTEQGVTIIGLTNLPSLLPVHASQLFARNLQTFLTYLAPQLNAGQFDSNDDIVKQSLITWRGEVIHPQFALKKE